MAAPFNVVTTSVRHEPDRQSDSFSLFSTGARGPVRSSRHVMTMRVQALFVKLRGYGAMSWPLRKTSESESTYENLVRRYCCWMRKKPASPEGTVTEMLVELPPDGRSVSSGLKAVARSGLYRTV